MYNKLFINTLLTFALIVWNFITHSPEMGLFGIL